MKKICITLILLFIISLTIAVNVNNQNESTEYLRIHIRANSNSVVDQNVKYKIKEEIVKYLTPYVAECNSKDEVIELLNDKEGEMESLIDSILISGGYGYKSNVAINKEKFPTRVYEDLVLNEGYYDAVIVELGEAKGDNWWCVVYPPLCFTGNECGIKYKSKILQIIENFKRKISHTS